MGKIHAPARYAVLRPQTASQAARERVAARQMALPFQSAIRSPTSLPCVRGGGFAVGEPGGVVTIPHRPKLTPVACGRPGRGSDSPLDCHSLPRLRFAYPLHKGAFCENRKPGGRDLLPPSERNFSAIQTNDLHSHIVWSFTIMISCFKQFVFPYLHSI